MEWVWLAHTRDIQLLIGLGWPCNLNSLIRVNLKTLVFWCVVLVLKFFVVVVVLPFCSEPEDGDVKQKLLEPFCHQDGNSLRMKLTLQRCR